MAYMRRYGAWPQDKSLVTPEDVEWHDSMLAEKWDSVVRPGDVVWVLGDLTANSKHVTSALHWIKNRPGHKHFVSGNHDPVHSMHTDAHKWQKQYYEVFDSLQTVSKRKLGGREVMLSHFPYTGDGDGREDRCSQYRLPNEGKPLLHGHVHTPIKVTHAEMERFGVSTGEHVPQLHVGLDAWDCTPVALETLAEMLTVVSDTPSSL